MSRNADNLLRRTQLLRFLLDRPAGATSEALAELAQFDTTPRKVTSLLNSAMDACMARNFISKGNRMWVLTDDMRRLMLTPYPANPPTREAIEKVMKPRRSISYHATTIQHKEAERQELAAGIARFRAQGGEIEVLGTTPTRPLPSLRTIQNRAAEPAAFTQSPWGATHD
ncbi:hypothetical protein [Stenotrophomonas sp. CFBP8994]|uniref:hypothetical protein n=1 Tax=Stenotrophomonas sp. CFBP8994 TaxID=3096527 RepID=UPI002A6A80D8|nr:hypothetical protein [Stenotrophomonas sp. CFBP8994]MDY0978963.1 hypothetical protein [Stenotrophomonas sp. CFBP8994]